MGTYVLNNAEKKLFDAIQHGDGVDFTGDAENKLSAVVLRHIVLGLPVVEEIEGVLRTAASPPELSGIQKSCALTGVGMSMRGAVIEGPLKLDAAMGMGGGPVCPLDFDGCRFEGGFSGRRAHFSRLRIKDCRFSDELCNREEDKDEQGPAGADEDPNWHWPSPSIDLRGATIDSGLNMQGIRAQGDELEGDAADRDYFEDRDEREEHHCWVSLEGARINGTLDLSRARLRVPPDQPNRLTSKSGIDALNLSLAEVNGDVRFLNGGLARGRIMSPSARIRGNLWLSGAKLNGMHRHALVLQLATIDGVLLLESRSDDVDNQSGKRTFRARGGLHFLDLRLGSALRIIEAEILRPSQDPFRKTEAATQDSPALCLSGARIVGNIKVLRSMFDGDVLAAPLRCEEDVVLHAMVVGRVHLEGASIAGSLDVSALQITRPESTASLEGAETTSGEAKPDFSLKDGRIGRTFRLAAEPDAEARFYVDGTVELTSLACGTLDDEVGQCWGKKACVRMNHFVYKQTGWLREPRNGTPTPSHKMLANWLLAKRAEGHWLLIWLPVTRRLRKDDYWQPWQLRRNWIYQQFKVGRRDPVSIARHRIREREYRPQPFEQAIRVARAEGRDDFATHFEMLKQRIEWGFFNRLVRWWLGFAGIALGTFWLVVHQRPADGSFYNWWLFAGTIFALGITLLLMVYATTVHGAVCRLLSNFGMRRPKRLEPGPLDRAVTWFIFFLPVLLLAVHSEWRDYPFHFLVAALIFAGIRFVSVFAHIVMRFGFGYLRRPVRAIVTLILVFLLGWGGVHIANSRNMMVVSAEPIANLAVPDREARYPPGYRARGTPMLMGSPRLGGGLAFVREPSCAATISEPLYALDVLIPIVDLGEETSCEVRRVKEPSPENGERRQQPAPPQPASMSFGQLWASMPDLALNDHRFWWWMKALYAIAGWIIVSLAILTFAQTNRTHAEPLTEHK